MKGVKFNYGRYTIPDECAAMMCETNSYVFFSVFLLIDSIAAVKGAVSL